MYRIRFHGRGGQGLKTASRILGSALFQCGFDIQDAPRYGAERRGAPIFAYVRADRRTINERGIITNPDLIVVADATLIPIPAVNITQGASSHTIMLIISGEEPEIWQQRLKYSGSIITLKTEAFYHQPEQHRYTGIISTAGAAALIPEVCWQHLEHAIRLELKELGNLIIDQNIEYAKQAYAQMAPKTKVIQGKPLSVAETEPVHWVSLPFAPARISAPAIHAGLTSVAVRTGLWRTRRPVIDTALCHRCWWICSTYCPDGAIEVSTDKRPHIDYAHCKGCMVCVSQCPHHAIAELPEKEFTSQQQKGAPQ